jgi:predicted dinucleotide-binding enzyme
VSERIAFIGHGRVGGTLAGQARRAGYPVTIAHAGTPSASLDAALAHNPGIDVAPPERAVADAGIVVLATPFGANADALAPVAGMLHGRVLVDCTNPVGPGLAHGLGGERSGAESVAELAPGAHVVKAFSVYGAETLADPRGMTAAMPPMMPICGDDPGAVARVAALAGALGWDPLPVGGLAQALHLEHMTLLWVRMVRAEGGSPRLAWAALRG